MSEQSWKYSMNKKINPVQLYKKSYNNPENKEKVEKAFYLRWIP